MTPIELKDVKVGGYYAVYSKTIVLKELCVFSPLSLRDKGTWKSNIYLSIVLDRDSHSIITFEEELQEAYVRYEDDSMWVEKMDVFELTPQEISVIVMQTI